MYHFRLKWLWSVIMGNWECSAFRQVGIPPSRGQHLALTKQFSLVGIPLVGVLACTR